MNNKDNQSKYLRYLPGIYQPEEKDNFLGRFLKAFENILSAYSLPQVDIKNPASLVSRLRDVNDPLSLYLRNLFSQETVSLLDGYDGSSPPSEALINALSLEFNNLLLKPVYDEKGFRKVILTGPTKELIKKSPGGNDLVLLNLSVLEEAFPDVIGKKKGIEEILDCIQDYFDPDKTPLEFLSWLAGWMALILKEEKDWNADNARKKRDLIAKIIPLYQKRGTLDGLKEYIKIYVGEDVKISIFEFLDPFRVGVTSTVGMNTVVGEGRPYYFQVFMELPMLDRVMLEKKKKAIIDIIDQEKPAHTYYVLVIQAPTMQIAYHSTVGVDTLLGGLIMGKNSD
ncbi:MAG: phage tail protein [Candidatus Methanoperedens sp.]|nr:phage tail protein [Candidatus Methanoperedens sp.]